MPLLLIYVNNPRTRTLFNLLIEIVLVMFNIYFGADPVFFSNRRRIVALAAHHAIPAVYELRDFADDGGLMTYGPGIVEADHQGGIYAARILKGEKPANLPVMQSTKLDFVINLKNSKGARPECPACAARNR